MGELSCEVLDIIVSSALLIVVVFVYWLPIKLFNRGCTYFIMIAFVSLAFNHIYAMFGDSWFPHASLVWVSKSLIPLAVFASLLVFAEKPRPVLEGLIYTALLFVVLSGSSVPWEWSIAIAAPVALLFTLFVNCKWAREKIDTTITTAMLSFTAAILAAALALRAEDRYDIFIVCHDPPDTIVITTHEDKAMWVLVAVIPLFLLRIIFIHAAGNKQCCFRNKRGCCWCSWRCIRRSIDCCGRHPSDSYDKVVGDSVWGSSDLDMD
jgi:hypothetical protein